MIRSPVHDNDHLLTPLDSVRICQASRQLRQEQLHNVLVRFALRQGQPNLSLRRDSGDYIDLEANRPIWKRIGLPSSLPAIASEVFARDPRLVDIKNVVPFTVELQHLSSIQLTKHQASF